MEKDCTELLFAADWSQNLPTEIPLFYFGVTETKKGSFLLDEISAKEVMRRFEDSGVDRLPFDVAHGMVKGSDNPDAHKAFGWFVPEIKQDIETGKMGLFATDIEWTDSGEEHLKKREFRFYSPAITFDPETRRITGLTNVALTNIPATKNQRPLVLDATEAQQVTNNERQEKHMQALLDSLSASDEASAVAKVGELKAVLSAVGVSSSKEAAEKIANLEAQAAKGIEAQTELAAVKKERAAEKRAVAIETLCADGKLLDSQKDFAAMLSDEQFEAFSATLKAHPVLSGGKIDEKAPGKDKEAELSDADRAIANALGSSVLLAALEEEN